MLGFQPWDNPDNRRATVALLDGARPDVFKSLANRGDLPNACRYLSSGGLVPATTVFPSTTGVAYLPFLTGRYPGSCNLPGIRWMDRTKYAGRWIRDRAHVRNYCGIQAGRFGEDVHEDATTLFDVEPDSVALCTPFTRGLTRDRVRTVFSRAVLGAMAHYAKNYEALDAAVARDLVRVAAEHRRLVFAVFPGIDGLTHSYDPWHPRVLDCYRQFDRALGRYVAAGGLDGDHLLAIVSDHGASHIARHVCIARALEAVGVRALRHPRLWRRRPHAAVMVSGNGAAHVYFAPGRPRPERWSVPQIEAGEVPGVPRWLVSHLADLDGVALVAGTDGDEIVLVSKTGRARLRQLQSGAIAYTPATADVLRIGCLAAVHGPREWLRRTYNRPYPDAPVQLTQIFRSARAGDLIVVAAPHADLRAEWEIPEHQSGHGSLVAHHMRCLVALNTPAAGPLRTVDLFPLVLRHLGHPVPADIDGVLEPEERRVAQGAGPA